MRIRITIRMVDSIVASLRCSPGNQTLRSLVSSRQKCGRVQTEGWAVPCPLGSSGVRLQPRSSFPRASKFRSRWQAHRDGPDRRTALPAVRQYRGNLLEEDRIYVDDAAALR